MTRARALTLLYQGEKLTHPYLGQESYLTLKDQKFYDEDNEFVGELLDPYMMGRQNSSFDHGWKLWTKSN